ncbi:MAG TPA: MBL fold metallo-hydrolase [Candidatus Olsenella pullistercoris]|uniref:MBL fold metallo-hydrolase n=1 Tax=Candidatus Olsenella pullistercoris TaxID=2838712 RepID=A0A9D2JED4_9ACTN|nr:MBL fold metallo-hydrolase [Candidatus Olsenella pullistercoris]
MGESRDELRQFVVTPLQTNCYAYVSAGECLVVDPGGSGAQVAERLSDVRVTCVAATHGHGDHVGGVAALVRATGAPFAIHAADAELARHAGEMSEVGRSYDENAPEPDRTLAEGDVIAVGTATFTVMETPGHTPGGVVLVGGGSAEGVAFVGDTLFPGSHGRTDLAGGDEGTIMASLARMAAEIDPATTLLCGHGPATTMERELRANPFLPRSL